MAFSLQGHAVGTGIALGPAVLLAPQASQAQRYLIDAGQQTAELARVQVACAAVLAELQGLQQGLRASAAGQAELLALLDVHVLLLQDPALAAGIAQLVQQHHYNAEWAVTEQLHNLTAAFDAAEDPYLRERGLDVQQLGERILWQLRGAHDSPLGVLLQQLRRDGAAERPILVARGLSPADMMRLRDGDFAGFVTDTGGSTSHMAILARSLGLPAVVGARHATRLLQAGDRTAVDGGSGLVVGAVPSRMWQTYQERLGDQARQQARLVHLRGLPASTRDGQAIQLLANIERPEDVPGALQAGASGIGLYRSEFLFMQRPGQLPGEEEQYQAYARVVQAMGGRPVTIRSIDLGADKTLQPGAGTVLVPGSALGLRAIRWSLRDPDVFLLQLRAILRVASLGEVRLLIPMIAQQAEIRAVFELLDHARQQLAQAGQAAGPLQLGAMIEVPAAALALPLFMPHFDFLSVGTNDLVQYLLAVDRTDDAVAHLYDPLHPAVLRVLGEVLATCNAAGKAVSICGEMAGDPALTPLLLGLGLRDFSMSAAQLLAVKQQVLQADTQQLAPWAQRVLDSLDPANLLAERA